MVDGKPLGNIPVIPDHNAADIGHDIKILVDLAKQLRDRRSQVGFLNGPSLKLTFKLDDRGHPIDCGTYQDSEANSIVEEVCQFVPSPLFILIYDCIVYAPHQHCDRSASSRPFP